MAFKGSYGEMCRNHKICYDLVSWGNVYRRGSGENVKGTVEFGALWFFGGFWRLGGKKMRRE